MAARISSRPFAFVAASRRVPEYRSAHAGYEVITFAVIPRARQREHGIQTLSNFSKGWIPGSAFGAPGMANTGYAAGQMAAMSATW
jgi:hypothetical protein